MIQHPRDAEHFHDPDAVNRIRASVLAQAAFRRNLRNALTSFRDDNRAEALAEVLVATYGKGKAFGLLEAAIAEVAK